MRLLFALVLGSCLSALPAYSNVILTRAGEESCVTNSGFPGLCQPIQTCYKNLFPVDSTYDDTPGGTGTYNQNLLRILIESSGFCGKMGSRQEETFGIAGVNVCCPNHKAEENVQLLEFSNETSVDDASFVRRSCGYVQAKLQPLRTPESDKIVGGRKAELGEYPWMVAMFVGGSQICGGSLIDNQNVLTAAHCVYGLSGQDMQSMALNIGDLNLYTSGETTHVVRRPKQILFHKGYNGGNNHAHDIALIHLDSPVQFSKTIQPVCLHVGNPPYDTGRESADVSGWGTTSQGGSQSAHLLTVTLKVITQNECNQKYAEKGLRVGPGMVCASSPARDSCQGDSGGPLVMNPRGQAKQIGIVSWGVGCAKYPGVYTRVDKYMDWINKNKQR